MRTKYCSIDIRTYVSLWGHLKRTGARVTHFASCKSLEAASTFQQTSLPYYLPVMFCSQHPLETPPLLQLFPQHLYLLRMKLCTRALLDVSGVKQTNKTRLRPRASGGEWTDKNNVAWQIKYIDLLRDVPRSVAKSPFHTVQLLRAALSSGLRSDEAPLTCLALPEHVFHSDTDFTRLISDWGALCILVACLITGTSAGDRKALWLSGSMLKLCSKQLIEVKAGEKNGNRGRGSGSIPLRYPPGF